MQHRNVLLAALVAVVMALAGCGSALAPAPELTAEQVMTRLTQQVPTAGQTMAYTAETDPNHMLGRPGGYTSKVNFADTRIPPEDVEFTDPDDTLRGGSVEVFPDQDGAERRKTYLDTIGPPLAGGYNYVNGGVLLRVSDRLTPTQAADYETALAAIS